MVKHSQKVLVIYNPKAGREDQADEVRYVIARHLDPLKWTTEIREMTGKEDVTAICRAACERGVSLVIAAGGDGTLVGVANGMVNTPVPLGILPLGTGNFLARSLLIPRRLEESIKLLVGTHSVLAVDALKVGERYYFSNVSVGITPKVMNETKPVNKRIFGRLAYVFAMIRQSSIFQLHRYKLTIDGRTQLIRAAEIMISSTTLLRKPPFLFGPPETLADGQIEVYVVTARTLGDYIRLVWDLLFRQGRSATKLSHWTAMQSVRIDALRSSPLVQADGEVIGHAPVAVLVVPKVLHVIMPKQSTTQTAN
jgi:YegS/Rv2252/BmrU family lipid kinase